MTSGFDILLVHQDGRASEAYEPAPRASIVAEVLDDLGPSDYAEGVVGEYRFWASRFLLPPETSEGDLTLQSLVAHSRCALRVTLAPEIWGVRWVKWVDGTVVRHLDRGVSDVEVDAGVPLASEEDIASLEPGAPRARPLSDIPAGDWDVVTLAGKTYIKVPEHLVPEYTPFGSFFTTDDPGVMFLHVIESGGKMELAHDPDEISDAAEDDSPSMDIYDAALTVLRAEAGLGDPHGWSIECEVHRMP